MATMEITVRIKNDDGTVIEKTIGTGKEIPNSGEIDLSDEQRFLTGFDKFERVAVETRDEAMRTIAKEYLGDAVKKRNRGPETEV